MIDPGFRRGDVNKSFPVWEEGRELRDEDIALKRILFTPPAPVPLFLYIFLASSLVTHPSSLQADALLAQQAALAWQARAEPGKTEEAIRLWKEAAQAEPQNVTHWIRLASAMGRAVRHAGSNQVRRSWADQARSAAEEAVRTGPESAEAYAVYGEALGQWANARKSMRSLSAVKKAVAALQRALTLKPNFAYAHMLLAQFYRQSPSLFSVGSKSKALEHARLAVQYGPGYAINHLALAEALLEHGQKKEAIQELQIIVSLVPPADAVPETRADQETALVMLKNMGIVSASASCGDFESGACLEKP